MSSGTLILIGIIALLVIIFLFKSNLRKNKDIKKEKANVLRERLQKEEMADLILHDAEIEEKVSEKVKHIQEASDDDLLAMGNERVYQHKSHSRKKAPTG